jgi:hypothetical protein
MVVPRGVLKDEGVGEEEGGQLEVFCLPIQKNGSGRHVKKFGRSSISRRARLFRLRQPLHGAAGGPQRPINRLEPRLHSVHGTLDLLRMGGHGGETLSHASNEEQANAMADSDGIMMA